MTRYSLFVLKVLLNTSKTKQTPSRSCRCRKVKPAL